MEPQTFLNIALGLVAFLGGWVVKNLQDSMKALRESDKQLAEKVQAIEVLVAGTYIKREAFDVAVVALFKKLDKIDDKLDTKANKAECDRFHRGGQ